MKIMKEIKQTRKALYGAWESQLEEIYDNGIDSWKARIAQIKTDHPKEIIMSKLEVDAIEPQSGNHVNYWCEWG
jgi:uncharacterized short protein YbdD (DUF466 family)